MSGQQQQQQQPPQAQPVAVVPKEIVDVFERQLQGLQHDALVAETSGKSVREISEKQFSIFKLYSSFLNSLRSYVYRNTMASDVETRVNVSLADIDLFERERQLSLFRMIIALNADTIGLGNEFLNSIQPDKLNKRIRDSLNQLSSGSETTADDETSEERNPQSVNLDNSDGVYSILGTEQATNIGDLIGYQDEAKRLVSYCRRVVFVDSANKEDASSSESNRNPVVIILSGPPGTGKTTIAQSVAKYLDTVYMYVNAENVVSQWAGVTEKNIVKIFRRARVASVKYAASPDARRRVLILIDEVDGLIKNRKSSNISPEVYSRITTFLQMLTPPVGVDNSNLIVIFTTNRLENIDDAIVNRAKGLIFMGYIVNPNERVRIMQNFFYKYAAAPLKTSDFLTTAYVCDDLVPRDLTNIRSHIRSFLTDKNSERVSPQDVVRVDLGLPENKMSVVDIIQTIRNWEPGTRAETLFQDYNPPLSHVCAWLKLNDQTARSYSQYMLHGRGCRV